MRGWSGNVGKAESGESDLFWRLLLASSTVAAGVSLLTTGLGLQRYVSLPLAWSLAVAVQLGLFGLAWLIGTGRGRRKAWISALYAVTMLFSVTFSYVTLQSELTAEIRPAEAQRRLFDASRTHVAELARQMNEGVRSSSELRLRLESWLQMERRDGWATRTCEEEDHCYLDGVCDRIRRRIDRWQRESGRTYREGPGEKMIYGTLETELRTLEQLERRIAGFRDELGQSSAGGSAGAASVLADGLDNRERLRRLDELSNRAPVGELEAVTCRAAALPPVPTYLDHARDRASSEEQPSYAFQDLLRIVAGEGPLGREDYPTLFALALAAFIDLFVLVVALGASTLREADPFEWGSSGSSGFLDRGSPFGGAPAAFEQALRRDLDGWVRGALLHGGEREADRRAFLVDLLAAVDFDVDGPVLVPETGEQRRVGHLLVQAGAARVETHVVYNRRGRRFRLAGWVVPAFHRQLGMAPSSGPGVPDPGAADPGATPLYEPA